MLGRRSASFRPADLTRAALTPIAERHGIDYDESGFTATFGEAANILRRLPRWRGGKVETLRRWATRQPGTDVEFLGRCGKAMLAVNKWRIAAAHSVLVDKATWDRTHTLVLDRRKGLLVQLCEALPDA